MSSTTHSPAPLSEQQRRQFERDGYLCPIRALNDREVERLLGSYMDYSAANKARLDALPPNKKYQVLSETHFVLPWVYEIVTHPRVLDAVEGLLGTRAPMHSMRGRWHEHHETPLMITFHPSYLLRNQSPTEKRKVWEDMLQVLERLERPISEKQRNYFT